MTETSTKIVKCFTTAKQITNFIAKYVPGSDRGIDLAEEIYTIALTDCNLSEEEAEKIVVLNMKLVGRC